jgi:arylsulfatase A-like enzyme
MSDASPKLKTHIQTEKEKRFNSSRISYDGFIRYCDKQFEDFIAQLTSRNRLKNTVVILSSDHGESFEHDYRGHGGPYLYEQLTHIPLIIKESEQSEGRIINDLIEQIDIPPTILDLANIPVPSWMEGRSLVPLMRGKRLPSIPAFSMNLAKNPSLWHQITKGTIAVWEGDYKLIHYLEEKKSLLFNLKQDPGELNNLFNKEPEVGQRLLTLIQDNLKMANERISSERHLINN